MVTKEDMFIVGSVYDEPVNLFQFGIAHELTGSLPDHLDIPVEDSIFFHNLDNRFVEKKEEDVSWMRKSHQIQESRVERDSIMNQAGKEAVEEKFVKDIKATADKSFDVVVPSVHPKSKKKMKRAIPLHPYFQCYGPEYHQFIFPDGLDLDENEEEKHLNTILLKPNKEQYGLFKCSSEHADMILQCRDEDRDLANEITFQKSRDYVADKFESDELKFLNIVIQNDNAYYIPTTKRNTMRKTRVVFN